MPVQDFSENETVHYSRPDPDDEIQDHRGRCKTDGMMEELTAARSVSNNGIRKNLIDIGTDT